MNCEKIQREILLEQSGELSARKRRRLLEHVSTCETCRQYREDALRVSAAARESAPPAEVSAFTLERIRQAAIEQARPPRHPRVAQAPFVILWRPALAAAAAALLLLAAWLVFWPRAHGPDAIQQAATAPEPPTAVAAVNTEWNGEFDEQIVELDVMLAMVSGEFSGADSSEADLEGADLDSIARELLELEGSS
ncbi:MAG: zf-HC2 domain-containing protein [Kiritimatiellae bacterium]|nr:zf-HC2 domain-containing protein [Kiritimatiellia bacterium]